MIVQEGRGVAGGGAVESGDEHGVRGTGFHAIARGSAFECAAILDVLQRFGAAAPDEVDQAKGLLSRIVAMLSKMCR